MEKAIIVFCLVLGMGCSFYDEPDNAKKNIPSDKSTSVNASKQFCGNLSKGVNGTFIDPKTVHWMYMDDSLKNICRPLNFQMPWMESDIKSIPEMITPEILSLSPIPTFELISKEKKILNDSITIFHYKLKRDNCNCIVARIYKGKVSDPKFNGFEITEQIVCNAKDDLIPNNLSKNTIQEEQKDTDTTIKYEVHGHEH